MIAGNNQQRHILYFIIACSLNITKMTRFFFRGGGGGGFSEWAIRVLSGVGVNLYDWTDDSKKIEM